jgi:hypothetical protein
MRRRTTLPGLMALTLACGAAIAATAVSATAVSATTGNAAKATAPAEVTGAAVTTSRVLGMFEMKGGPSHPGAKGSTPTPPLSGIVMFRDKKGHTTDITAGKNGHFTGIVTAGTYTVTARSPQIRQGDPNGTYSDPPCAGPVTVVARGGHTTDLTLVCYVP